MKFELLQCVRIVPEMIEKCVPTKKEREHVIAQRGLVVGFHQRAVMVIWQSGLVADYAESELLPANLSDQPSEPPRKTLRCYL